MNISLSNNIIRIVFPEECENFMAETALEALLNLDLEDKTDAQIDLSGVRTLDTTFVNIILSLVNTLKGKGIKYEFLEKSDEAVRVLGLYGLKV